jgi:hypothetical protein
MPALVAAQTARGEQKDESHGDESADDHGFLDASPSDRESRIHAHGGDHDVHLDAPVATATPLILAERRYKDITGTPSGYQKVLDERDPTNGELRANA